jgi:hypothetical protein
VASSLRSGVARCIFPLIEKHLTVDEWTEMGQRAFEKFPRSAMPVLVGQLLEVATPDEAASFLRGLPLGPRLLWVVAGRRHYRRYVERVRGGGSPRRQKRVLASVARTASDAHTAIYRRSNGRRAGSANGGPPAAPDHDRSPVGPAVDPSCGLLPGRQRLRRRCVEWRLFPTVVVGLQPAGQPASFRPGGRADGAGAGARGTGSRLGPPLVERHHAVSRLPQVPGQGATPHPHLRAHPVSRGRTASAGRPVSAGS